MILNILVTLFFGYLLATKDYSKNAKWMYYMDGFIFAINFAFVLVSITNMLGV
jgi:hypothetical protein